MKKTFLLISLLCVLSAELIAQTISGTVFNAVNTPISYATVVLCNAKDTTQVAYTITDNDGKFSITSSSLSHKVTDYLLQVSYIGYKSVYAQAQSTQEIILEQDALAFDEAVVKGVRPISKITADGILTIIENTAISGIGTGDDVLQRIPMLSGGSGMYEIFGRGEAKIYINNREVRDPSEIDNLNSVDIQSVEVISNPGAMYDASVKAIIKIKTIKKHGDGFSFNARTSFYTWENEDYVNQLNTNYRKGGLDIFTSIYHTDISSFNRRWVTEVVNVDTTWILASDNNFASRRNMLKGTVGVNYEINKNHNLGFRYDIKTFPKNDTELEEYETQVNINGNLYDKWNNLGTTEIDNQHGSQVNLYYTGKVNKLSIEVNADYMNSGSNTNTVLEEKSANQGDSTYNSNNYIDNELWAGKVQLSYPVSKGELLVGSEYVNISRVDNYINYDLDGFTSNIDIDEKNIALFTQYNLGTKVGYFALGLRYENVDYAYLVDDKIDNNKSKRYNQWFPSFTYSNRVGELNFQVNYTSNVTRPTYFQLSNSLTYNHKLSLYQGNPYLKPTINQDLSLVGVWRFIQMSINYTHQKNAIVQWMERYKDNENITVHTYKNISSIPKLAVMVNVAPSWGIYKPQLSLGMQKLWQDYSEYGVDEKMRQPAFFASLENIFELKNDLLINFDATYLSKGYGYNTYQERHRLVLDLGVSKYFFKKSLQVKLMCNDFINQHLVFSSTMPQYHISNDSYMDSRDFSLTLRYNFNSAKNRYKGEGAGEDAKQRF